MTNEFSQLYLRLMIGIGYLVPALDRFGVWGPPGAKNVSWGNWDNFVKYAYEVMSFFPETTAYPLAIIATTAEITIGTFLIIGWWTKGMAIGSGILAGLFAISMAVSFGIVSPLSYSVFVVSAASFHLSTIDRYKWSVDEKLESSAGQHTKGKNY